MQIRPWAGYARRPAPPSFGKAVHGDYGLFLYKFHYHVGFRLAKGTELVHKLIKFVGAAVHVQHHILAARHAVSPCDKLVLLYIL